MGKKIFDDEEKIDEGKYKKDLAFYEPDYIELGGCNIDNFRIDDKNSVSLNRDIKDFQQLFWDTKHQRGNLHFRIKINRTRNGWIIIGVVDKRAQKEMTSSYRSGNAICFDGSSSRIYYGKEGHFTYTKVKEKAEEGMEILVEMNMMMKTVEFNFRSMSTESKHLIDDSILKESNREFVPYIEMMHPGDSISWWVQ